jgi:3-hydroxyisobutyrate dehydrogenase-like beta-hydroxyacid dehydrogenase
MSMFWGFAVAGYVDMSTVDEATSKSIGKAITEAGGRFLEVGRD